MRILTAALVVALVLGGWQFLRARHLDQMLTIETQALEAMTGNRDRWQANAHQVLEELAEQRQRARQAEAAVAELMATLESTHADYQALERQVRQAPAEDDGPVAPVLRQALEALP